jgi:hypothetical protein
MKKTLLTLALSALSLASSFASTLQANTIFATSAENYDTAVHFAIHNDQAGLEEIDREWKINVFKVPLEVIVRQPGFLTKVASLRTPGISCTAACSRRIPGEYAAQSGLLL